MDCLFAALRMSCVSGSAASDEHDAVRGFARNRVSRRASSFAEGESCPTPPHLKRKRAAAFFLSFYLCGVKVSEEAVDEAAEVRFKVEMSGGQEQIKETKEVRHWCEEKVKKRRKLGSEEWAPGDDSFSVFCEGPARLRRLLRRVRAKVRRMGQVQKTANFHYDPLSYSMNFDDGFWQHSETHARLFCHSPHAERFFSSSGTSLNSVSHEGSSP